MEEYQTIYNVSLLDDIHNYFPDILYHPSRFSTVRELLLYFQQCVQRRFNLLEYGRRVSNQANTFTREIPRTSVQTQIPSLFYTISRATAFEDVIVHASQATIDANSTLTTLERELDYNCSICQDKMAEGETVRNLTICQHSFHRACIDNWLLTRSVYCPTCRHDIRETTPRTQEASVPSTQQDASSILNMQDLLRVLSSYR
jgi:hypothetical protein